MRRWLWSVVRAAPHDPAARRFIVSILIAFLPAVVIGVLAHDFIKTVLFETPMLIAVMLILGRCRPAVRGPAGADAGASTTRCALPLRHGAEDRAVPVSCDDPRRLAVGGDHRGGAYGWGRGSGRRRSFRSSCRCRRWPGRWPMTSTRTATCSTASAVSEIAVGFAVAFVSAVVVVRWLLGYVSSNGYALFGWWRIVVGSVALGGAFAGLLRRIGQLF